MWRTYRRQHMKSSAKMLIIGVPTLLAVALAIYLPYRHIKGERRPYRRYISAEQMRVGARETLRHAEEELARNPRSAFWHNQAGVCQAALGNFGEARNHFTDAISLEPEDPINYYHLAAIERTQGNLNRAKDLLEKALALDPRNPSGHCHLGNVLLTEGDWQYARSEFDACLAAIPSQGNDYYDPRGNAYGLVGLREDAKSKLSSIQKK
jgi:tetratricopeptide (TPR) repeat protein